MYNNYNVHVHVYIAAFLEIGKTNDCLISGNYLWESLFERCLSPWRPTLPSLRWATTACNQATLTLWDRTGGQCVGTWEDMGERKKNIHIYPCHPHIHVCMPWWKRRANACCVGPFVIVGIVPSARFWWGDHFHLLCIWHQLLGRTGTVSGYYILQHGHRGCCPFVGGQQTQKIEICIGIAPLYLTILLFGL